MLLKSQQKLISHFSGAVKTDSLRQAYIIKGESGLGKRTSQKEIGRYIMCFDGTGCGSCNGCHSYDSMANPDCIRVSNGDKKNIELAKIREMIKEVYIKPILGKYKLFVIENAHLMGEASQNALLKVIEEPPSYAVFILLCDNISAILPTILSRSMVLELESAGTDDLKKICPLPVKDEYMYTYCLGNIGTLKAMSSDDNFKTLRTGASDSFLKMLSSDEYGIYECIEFWEKNKEFKTELINILTMFLRDVVLYKSSASAYIANTDKIKEIQTLSQGLTLKSAYDMLSVANNAPRIMGKYGNVSMAVHTMMMQIKKISTQSPGRK